MIYSLSIITARYLIERSISCRNLSKTLPTLARKLLFNKCAKTIEFIKQIVDSPEFISRHRQKKTDFTRNRKLPFNILFLFLINCVRGAYQSELDNFFKTLFRFDVAKRVVSKVALSKARMKLKFEAFVEINMHLIRYFDQHFKPRTWHGFRLLAIDASTTRLPVSQTIIDHFGLWNTRCGAPSPIARISQLFDVLNKITVDAILKPKKIGERELAADHLLNVMPNDLLLLDRGYPAWWLFNLIISQSANFCARISCTKWKAVRKFYYSRLPEKTIRLPIHTTSVSQCRHMGLDRNPMELRLIRVDLGHKTHILITSLVDKKKYPIELFYDLYKNRWPIEEDYKTIKCRMELENFSGKSALSVYQDFHAKILLKNLVSIMAFPIKIKLETDNHIRKYKYQINFTHALSISKGVVIMLFKIKSRKLRSLIKDLHNIFQRTIEPIRVGRKIPRNFNRTRRKFSIQYKPIV